MIKVIITALLMLHVTLGISYGAVSEDMSVYVRKDVFEVYMQNMNANMERMIQRFDRIDQRLDRLDKSVNDLAQTVALMSGRVDGLDKRMDSLNSRIDDLRNGIYLWLMLISILIAWPKVRDKLPKWGKSAPSLTLEDVNRLMDERLKGSPQV